MLVTAIYLPRTGSAAKFKARPRLVTRRDSYQASCIGLDSFEHSDHQPSGSISAAAALACIRKDNTPDTYMLLHLGPAQRIPTCVCAKMHTVSLCWAQAIHFLITLLTGRTALFASLSLRYVLFPARYHSLTLSLNDRSVCLPVCVPAKAVSAG